MLARVSKPSSAVDFAQLLVVPQPPASIAAAEEALRKATSAREEGQQRHIEAGRRLANQPLGQPPQISQRDVDEIGATLQPLFDAEAKAKAYRDEQVQAFEQSIGPSLAEPLKQFRQAVGQALNDLEELLAQGAAFSAGARAARFDLSRIDKLPATCEHMRERLHLARSVFDRI
ncbi:MAG: hypothetical protein EOR60_09590 [Mesorhizobium sp.]|nr:MAG: hypothetical protein EOR60_09590 [Mesorhizobium sp.]